MSHVPGELTPSHLQAFSATFTHFPETAGEYPCCWDVSLEDALRCVLVTDVETLKTLLFLGAFACLTFGVRQSTQHLIPFAAIWQTYPWSPENTDEGFYKHSSGPATPSSSTVASIQFWSIALKNMSLHILFWKYIHFHILTSSIQYMYSSSHMLSSDWIPFT